MATVVQTPAMVFAFVLSLAGLLSSVPALPSGQDHGITYSTAVTFSEGKCWFWTGDVGLTALDFEKDVDSRFDRQRAVIISHAANTPTPCVEMARRSAARAGFKLIDTEVQAYAGPIGPPVNGN